MSRSKIKVKDKSVAQQGMEIWAKIIGQFEFIWNMKS